MLACWQYISGLDVSRLCCITWCDYIESVSAIKAAMAAAPNLLELVLLMLLMLLLLHGAMRQTVDLTPPCEIAACTLLIAFVDCAHMWDISMQRYFWL
jgi:hypothetical protein